MARAKRIFFAAFFLLPTAALPSFVLANIEVEERGENLLIRNGKIAIEYDLTTGWWKVAGVEAGDAEAALATKCRITIGKQIPTAGLYEMGYTTQALRDEHGSGMSILIHHTATAPDYPELVLTFRVYDKQPSFLCGLRLTAPRELGWPVSTITLEGTLTIFSRIPECRILSNFSQGTSCTDILWLDFAPGKSSAQTDSDFYSVVHERPTRKSAIIGSTTARSEIRLSIAGDEGTSALRFIAEARHQPAMIVHAGVSSDTDIFYFGFPENVFDGMEDYASHVRTNSRAEIWKSPPCGWSPPQRPGARVSEEDAVRAADFLARELKPYGMEYICVPDKWEASSLVTGDRQPDDKFPHGAAWLADQFHKRGLKAGLRMAPFGEESASSPLPFRIGKSYDVTDPAFQRWLRSTCSIIAHNARYDYVVADYLRYGKVGRNLPFDVAYRDSVKLMKGALGRGCYLLLSGNDEWLTVGISDGQRIGNDINGTWAGLLQAIRSGSRRYLTQGNFWLADPGPLHIGPPLTTRQARVWATAFALFGGPIMSGDNLWELPPERIELLRRVIPPNSRSARPLDLFEPAKGYAPRLPRIWHLPAHSRPDPYHVVALFNWDNQAAQEVTLNFADIGFKDDEKAIAYDFWGDRLLGVFAGYLSLVLDPTSTVVLAIHKFSGKPCFLSTDRHILQGAADVVGLSWDDEKSALQGIAGAPKGRGYSLTVYCPSGFQAARAVVNNQDAGLLKPGKELVQLRFLPDADESRWQISFFRAGTFQAREPDPSRMGLPPEERLGRRPFPLVDLPPDWHEECHDNEGSFSVENDDIRVLAPCVICYDLRAEFKRLTGAVRSRARRADTSLLFEAMVDGKKVADGRIAPGQRATIDVDVAGKRELRLIGHTLTGSDSDAWMTWEDLKLE